MRQYECVQVDHHESIAQVIEKYVIAGWSLNTYQAVSTTTWPFVFHYAKHYLLFEKENVKETTAKSEKHSPKNENLSPKEKLEREEKLARIREQIDKDVSNRTNA
jgi:hypothetical protein